MEKISLGISPCPNDTFMFDALIHEKIDTEGLSFETTLLDVEELNSKSIEQTFDVTKMSFHAMLYQMENYQLLNSGSALGRGVGPLLIAKHHLNEDEIDQAVIGIPGKMTTANFLLSLAYPRVENKREYLFSEIEEAVLSGEVDAGLIIHENRFTYQEKGLVKLIDLGNYWEELSDGLIPLGGIVIKRNMSDELKAKVDRLIKKSIQYAFDNESEKSDFVRSNAQEMNSDVLKKHIDLYVNQYSIDLGEEGRDAVQTLFNLAVEKQMIRKISNSIFV